jgi:hypothetical protein
LRRPQPATASDAQEEEAQLTRHVLTIETDADAPTAQKRTPARVSPVTTAIEAGWDKLHGGFFARATVTHEAGVSVLYSNLEDETLDTPYPVTFEPLIDRLAGVGIRLPRTMVEQIKIDGRNNTADRTLRWRPNGTWIEPLDAERKSMQRALF